MIKVLSATVILYHGLRYINVSHVHNVTCQIYLNLKMGQGQDLGGKAVQEGHSLGQDKHLCQLGIRVRFRVEVRVKQSFMISMWVDRGQEVQEQDQVRLSFSWITVVEW